MANHYTIEFGRDLLKWREVLTDQRFWTEAEAKAAAQVVLDSEPAYRAVRVLRNGKPVSFNEGNGWEDRNA